MKIKRIEHIAIATRNLDQLHDFFVNKIGVTFEYEQSFPQYDTRMAMYPVGQTYLEAIQPTSDRADVDAWIKEHGEGLYHICLEVEDIDSALIELKAKGVKLIHETPIVGHGNSRIAFLEPSQSSGVMIELVQLPEGHETKAC
jgi:methylmalonyl-CoA/ethylmalonyl-CoA epimerase